MKVIKLLIVFAPIISETNLGLGISQISFRCH